MSHGVHAVQHEVEHKIEHDEHGGGHNDSTDRNKKVALLIAVLALFLAFSETMGKSAQTDGLSSNIEASNLWNFFQAKNIRRTSTIIASEQTKLIAAAADPAQKAAIEKQVDEWNKTAARYRSEPEAGGGKGEGTVELSRRAIEKEHHRDEYFAKYHHYEFASAAFQIGIVLASATVITDMIVLSFLAGGLGVIGLAFMTFGLIAPHLLHLH